MALSNAMSMLTESFLGAYADRIAQVASICSDTAQTLSEFHDVHQRMATEQRHKLADHMDALHSNVAATLSSLDKSHHQMADELRQRLTEQRERLLSDVSKMRDDMQTDHGKARKIWTDFSAEMQQRRAKKSGAPSKKAAASQTAGAQGMVDDLTVITGVGVSREQRLNEMGIHTFAQLASSAPQKIRKAFGASAHTANVEQWIKEARKLSSN